MAKISSHVKEDEEGKTTLYLKLQFEDKLERELKSDLKKGHCTTLHMKTYVLYYLNHHYASVQYAFLSVSIVLYSNCAIRKLLV